MEKKLRPPQQRPHPLPPAEKKARARRIFQLLKKAYPDAHCELNFTNPMELLVATILSAQCTDVRVNQVTPPLFQRYRSVKDYAEAETNELESLIRSTGFYHNKAKNIVACCRRIFEKHHGEIPSSMEHLHSLPGIGRKTANVILGNAFGLNEGVVVDTHVIRLSQRLGLSQHTDPVKIECDLMEFLPKKNWTQASHWLVWHGRRRCYARKPDCPHCELKEVCPSYPIL